MRKNKREQKLLSKRIKKLRKECEWTQEELAERVGVTSTYIGFIEQGQRVPALKTADKIARALGISLSDLLKDS